MNSDGTVFVGRERELSELLQRLNLANGGYGGVVLVAGEPGIGKTRLIQEVATLTKAKGGLVLWGRCWNPEMGAPAFWPWTEVLTSCVKTLDHDVLRSVLSASPAELALLIPEFKSSIPGLGSQEREESEDARFGIFRAATEFLRQLALSFKEEKTPIPAGPGCSPSATDGASLPPLLVVLDDLHWADKASLLLLHYIARERVPLPFLVVGAYDSTALDREHPSKSAVAAIQRESTVMRIDLQGLKAADVRALVEARVGPRRRTLAHAIAKALYPVTEGNPFFLVETLNQLLQDTQEFGRKWPSVQGSTIVGDLVVPASVRGVVEKSIAHLPDDTCRILGIAALIGRDFEMTLLASITAIDAQRLDKVLGEAETAGLIVPVDCGDRFRFRHALLRKTLYDSIPIRVKLHLHRLIAEGIEALSKDEQYNRSSELAYHYGQIGDREKIRLYSRLAAERAEQTTAWEEALRQYETCFKLMDAEDTAEVAERASMLVAMGRCARNVNDRRTAWRYFGQAISLFEEVGDGVSVAKAVFEALTVAVPPDGQEVLVSRALAALGDRDPRLEAQLELDRALWTSSEDAAADSLRRVAELAKCHGLADVATILKQTEGNRALRDGRPDEAQRIFEKLYESCEGLGRKGSALGFLISADTIPLFAGALDEGEDCTWQAVRYAEERGNRPREARLLTWLAGVALARGEVDRYLALLERSEDLNPANFSGASLRALRCELVGELDRALAKAPSPEPTGGFPGWLALVHGGRARIRFHAGDLNGAREDLARWEQNRRLFRLTDGAPNYLHTLTCLDEALPALGREALVEEVYAELRQWSWARFSPANACGIDQLRGALAIRLGDLDAAETHYSEGQVWTEREGCQVERGRCLMGRAVVKAQRAQLTEALALLHESCSIFQKNGVLIYLRQGTAKIDEISRRQPGELGNDRTLGTPFTNDLSGREIEVLYLICNGLTNQQIADQLCISSNTVARHITHIFNKTGTSNRAEVVSYAHRVHIVPLSTTRLQSSPQD